MVEALHSLAFAFVLGLSVGMVATRMAIRRRDRRRAARLVQHAHVALQMRRPRGPQAVRREVAHG